MEEEENLVRKGVVKVEKLKENHTSEKEKPKEKEKQKEEDKFLK